MPTLHEWQRAMRNSLVANDPTVIASLADGVSADRLDIYRNTIFLGLTKALRLAYPTVERLVGEEFFDGAADIFIRANLPRTACLNYYGQAFAEFLQGFAPAATLPYLADVGRLEWAVSGALHAIDDTPLQLSQLAAVDADDEINVVLRPRASVRLIRLDYAADEVWRAVLNRDDEALASLNPDAGPVFLLIERGEHGIVVNRLPEPEWRFLSALCAGQPLAAAIEGSVAIDGPSALASHLAAARFCGFELDSGAARAA